MASLTMFQNECRYRFAAFAAFDLEKSSIKIAYPERNTAEKKPMVTVKSVNSWKGSVFCCSKTLWHDVV